MRSRNASCALALALLLGASAVSCGRHSTSIASLTALSPTPTAEPSPTLSGPEPSAASGTGTATPSHTIIEVLPAPSVGSATPTPPASAEPSATSGSATLRITANDSGRAFTVHVGTQIHVELAPNAGSYDPPANDDSHVLREDSHAGGYPDNSTAIANFTAVARGAAHITSQTDMACLHTNPRCLPPQRSFSVTINVA